MFNIFPYTDFHELNLDMILRMIKSLHEEMTTFEALNTIKYEGVWNITRSYKAWSVVTSDDGLTGYVSIQPVLPGIDISNTDYWRKIMDAPTIISNLKDRVNVTSNLHCMFIGDSWGVQGAASAFQNKMNFAEFYQSCYGGSGYVATGDPPATDKTFLKLYNDLCDTLTYDELMGVDILIVAGGVNDNSSLPSITVAVENFVDTARLRTPNAKIYSLCINNSLNGAWNRFAYVDEIAKASGYKGLKVCDLTRCAKMTQYSNNGHLSDYNTIADNMIAAINGTHLGAGYATKVLTYSIADLSISDKAMTIYQHNDEIYMFLATSYFNGSYAFSGVLTLDVTLSDYLIPFFAGEELRMTVNCKYSGDSNYTAVPAILSLINGNVTLKILGRSSDTLVELYIPPTMLNAKW